ncbi:MAG: cobalamin-dependent protein, partial [bacterium]|nr:cobalamin-dependent protein [bacterium]
MVKCVLISYAGYPYTLSSLLPDNGLANLAGALIRAGHKARILDYGTVSTIKRLIPQNHTEELNRLFKQYGNRIYKEGLVESNRLNENLQEYQEGQAREIGKEIARFIQTEKADFAGIKLWNGDGFTGSIMIAEEIKKLLPGFPVVAGGPHVDMYNKYIWERTDAFDLLAQGEGEETIVRLADHYDGRTSLAGIPNLIYRKGDEVITAEKKWIEDLNTLPFPVYDKDVYLAMKGDEKIKIVVLDESRGCPNTCFFCMQPMKSGNRIRIKKAERII